MPRLTAEREKEIRDKIIPFCTEHHAVTQLLDELDALRVENQRFLNLRLPRPSQFWGENAQLIAERDLARTHYGDALFEITQLRQQLKVAVEALELSRDAIKALAATQQQKGLGLIGELLAPDTIGRVDEALAKIWDKKE